MYVLGGCTKHPDWAFNIDIWSVRQSPLHVSVCRLSLIAHSPEPTLHVLIFKSVSSPPMIIHVHLTLKQALINCGTLGHTLGQITQP